MKIKLIIIFICVFFNLTFAQKNKDIPSSEWSKAKIKVDGDISDWTNPFRYYNSEAMMAFSITNDSSNLYLCFKISDKSMQMKILRSGIIIGLDTNGKKKKRLSITYPVSSGAAPDFKQGQKQDAVSFRNSFKLQSQYMVLSGFRTCNGKSPEQCENGLMVKLDWDKNHDMICEVLIPFKSFRNGNLSNNDLSKVQSLIISIPAMENPKMNSGGGRPMEGGVQEMGNEGGGFPGGINRQEGNVPGSMGNPPVGVEQSLFFEEQKFTQKFKLSLQGELQ